ncbi:unnamed protein product [Enterobius vermicularis]|uniref:TIR domain-containing protein n=1 Tax=Enterobius vermicularis TaxID=51028 RepID=A0A0N4VJH2_ENTVE|nr:unnamed protein product [Enterobius vermicularis]
MGCSVWLFVTVFLPLLSNGDVGDIHHILCPRGCNCYTEKNTDAQFSFLHFVCRWEHLNSQALNDVAESDPIYTIRIQCPHGSTFKTDPPDKLFYRLKNLEHITIHRCKIQNLKKEFFKKQRRLNSLKITSADLPHLPNDLFEYIPKLRYLDLSDNNLKIVPYPISQLNNLEYLILSRNWIQFMSSGLSSLKLLKHLILDGNNLTSIDFGQIPQSVDTLRLRANQLKTFINDDVSNRSLNFLDLAKNKLEYLTTTGTINKLPSSLNVVYLNGNNIEIIQDGSFAHMKHLSEIDLRNNLLRDLPQSIFNEVKHKFIVKLTGNPFNCVCSLQWILDAETPVYFGDLDRITCKQLFDEQMEISIAKAKRYLFVLIPVILISVSIYTFYYRLFHNVSLMSNSFRRGDLICNYEIACPQDCKCCLKPTGQNIVECEGFREDRVSELPALATEIRLKNTSSKGWSTKVLGRRRRLKSLNLTNAGVSKVTEDLIKDNFPALQHLDLSNNFLKTFPAAKLYGVVNLQTLFIENNRITNLNMSDLKRMEFYKRLKLGGESNLYHCDCDSPSDIQIWLHDQDNRGKVSDYGNIFCKLKDDRVVRMAQMSPLHPNTFCPLLTTRSTTVVSGDAAETDSYNHEIHRNIFGPRTLNQFVTQKSLRQNGKPRSHTVPYHRHSELSSTTNKFDDGSKTTVKPKLDLQRRIMITITLFLALILLVFLLIAIGIIAYFRYNYVGHKSPKKTRIKAVYKRGTPGTAL